MKDHKVPLWICGKFEPQSNKVLGMFFRLWCLVIKNDGSRTETSETWAKLLHEPEFIFRSYKAFLTYNFKPLRVTEVKLSGGRTGITFSVPSPTPKKSLKPIEDHRNILMKELCSMYHPKKTQLQQRLFKNTFNSIMREASHKQLKRKDKIVLEQNLYKKIIEYLEWEKTTDDWVTNSDYLPELGTWLGDKRWVTNAKYKQHLMGIHRKSHAIPKGIQPPEHNPNLKNEIVAAIEEGVNNDF